MTCHYDYNTVLGADGELEAPPWYLALPKPWPKPTAGMIFRRY
eukprot:SAG22_NODE_7117_length_774_cov_0.980741_1_plen_43_part_00